MEPSLGTPSSPFHTPPARTRLTPLSLFCPRTSPSTTPAIPGSEYSSLPALSQPAISFPLSSISMAAVSYFLVSPLPPSTLRPPASPLLSPPSFSPSTIASHPSTVSPAAYEDATDAILWVRAQARQPSSADPWLRDHADFSRCFLMGSSSGGNIAYRAAVLAAGLDLDPLKLEGLILNQPFFGGEIRTESEERMADDHILPLPANDLLWELALPLGANRDHEFCNPMAVEPEEEVVRRLPKCLVRGYVQDPLVDRQREFARMLARRGVRVVALLEEEGHHAIEIFKASKAAELVEQVGAFVRGNVGEHKL
ncbi:hypothetical protein HPP92_022201 [Vanilla planifolia]|uniref:Alpha/beta hydrolase fold-3 domain-containing protein n=1 Tax=Vanilla planifolia TaxID=51239 RepID=A0A835UBP6_VANPL|nr:hypothetical protein HPP92_022201 [Vanilla planifolia]